jgi:hypothetical protein
MAGRPVFVLAPYRAAPPEPYFSLLNSGFSTFEQASFAKAILSCSISRSSSFTRFSRLF